MKGVIKLMALGLGLTSLSALSQTTGGDEPFNNLQPSLVVTVAMPLSGVYPYNGGGFAYGGTVGFVYAFAGNFAPGTSLKPQGQLLSVSTNFNLFSVVGTTYGGDGSTTFALPNLQGTALIGVGTGPGLSPRTLGAATGMASVTLVTNQLPEHNHTWGVGGITGTAGAGQPFSNLQPSLPVQRLIATNGIYPSGGTNASFLGQIANFAGNGVPDGWLPCDGRLLNIFQNTALFSLLGTTFGGDGSTTFGLPDLRGRVSVGAHTAHPLGTKFGQESITLSLAQMAAHDHTVPGFGVTSTVGSGQLVTNIQPSLALNYLIATNGIFPSQQTGPGFDQYQPVLGQITEFAGNFSPPGWLPCDGRLLQISGNTSLFSLIGTLYGGDGSTTFALPDLRGRTLIGSGTNGGVNYAIGGTFGAENHTLTITNLPAHSHSISITPPTLVVGNILTNGAFQFSFTNHEVTNFTVLTSTNVTLPFNDWTSLGSPSVIGPGLFEFTDLTTTNDAQRYYRVRSP